ncbi:MAG: hypothetical protein GX880_08215 [Methanomicrobiales archaeon]|nr:hypothetical protein [Methanomicrobiales archaeon]
MQSEKAAAGLRHMLDLQEFCRTHGEVRTFDLGWMDGAAGVRLTVLRAREVAADHPTSAHL